MVIEPAASRGCVPPDWPRGHRTSMRSTIQQAIANQSCARGVAHARALDRRSSAQSIVGPMPVSSTHDRSAVPHHQTAVTTAGRGSEQRCQQDPRSRAVRPRRRGGLDRHAHPNVRRRLPARWTDSTSRHRLDGRELDRARLGGRAPEGADQPSHSLLHRASAGSTTALGGRQIGRCREIEVRRTVVNGVKLVGCVTQEPLGVWWTLGGSSISLNALASSPTSSPRWASAGRGPHPRSPGTSRLSLRAAPGRQPGEAIR
jgi:hypothetical protein